MVSSLGAGRQCARENTAFWVSQRVAKVKKAQEQLGLDPERLRVFMSPDNGDAATELDNFAQEIGKLYLASALMQEVKK